MATKASFITNYGNSKPAKRIDIILDYYQDFPTIIEGQQESLVYRIKNERDYVRQSRSGDLGVRVQSSGTSNPTLREAIENLSIQAAVNGEENMDELLQYVDRKEVKEIFREFFILQKMREEYRLLTNQLLLLSSKEKKIFKFFIEGNRDFQDLAEAAGIQNDSARRRIWQIKKKIKDETVESMLENL